MKLTKRKILVVFLAFLFVFCASLCVNTFTAKTVSADSDVITTFDIDKGASIRLLTPTGIRFSTYVKKTYLDEELKDKEVTFGTLLIPSSNFKDEVLTLDTKGVMDVVSETWGVCEDDDYYVYNVVLYNIPETEYSTDIMARSYVIIDGEITYSKTTTERSVARVASSALKDEKTKYNDEQKDVLTSFVSKVDSISLDVTHSELHVGDILDLSLNENYDAMWESDNEDVATVDNSGKVTAVGGGVATITATVGNAEASCAIAVMENDEASWGTLEKTYQQRNGANNWAYPFVFDHFVDASSVTFDNNAYTIKNTNSSSSAYRFYANFLNDYHAKDTVKIALTYTSKISGTLQVPKLDGTSSTFDIAVTEQERTIVFDGIVSTASFDYNYLNNMINKVPPDLKQKTVDALFVGENENNVSFSVNIAKNGETFTIKRIEIAPYYEQSVLTEQIIDANTEINLVETLGISNVTGTMDYAVTDKKGNEVTVTDGKFMSDEGQNYYDVTTSAGSSAGNYSNGVTVRLIIEGTYVIVGGATYQEPIGTSPQFKTTTAWSQYRLYLKGLKNYNAGDEVGVSLNLLTVLGANMNRALFIIGNDKCANNVDQKTNWIPAGNSGWLTREFIATVCTSDYDYSPLTSIEGDKAPHIKLTFLIENSSTHAHAATYWAIKEAKLYPMFSMANQEVVVDANTEIDIAEVAGIDNVFGTMSYSAVDKEGKAVTVTNGKFSTGEGQNYYDVTATATIGDVTTSKTVRFIVSGTYMVVGDKYTSSQYSSNNLIVDKNADKGSLTQYRLYVKGLEDYKVGDIVQFKLHYQTAKMSAGTAQHFLVVMQKTGDNPYPTLDLNTDSYLTYSAVVTTSEKDFPSMLGGLTTLEGTAAKHLKIQTWFYSGGHIDGSFIIKGAELIWGNIESVGGCNVSVDGDNLKLSATSGNSNTRLYITDLNSYNVGDVVSITLTYVYETNYPTSNERCIYGPVSSTALGLMANRKTLIADNTEHSITFNGVVTNTSGAMSGSPAISGGTNVKNVYASFWLNNDGVFVIKNIVINK